MKRVENIGKKLKYPTEQRKQVYKMRKLLIKALTSSNDENIKHHSLTKFKTPSKEEKSKIHRIKERRK